MLPMETIVLALLMVALLAFIIWDRRQPAKTPSRSQMDQGVIPGGTQKIVILGTLAATSFALGIAEWLNPTLPPFSGKGALIQAVAHAILGENGTAWLYSVIGIIFATLIIRVNRTAKSK